jgi:hypothetical protein
LAKDAIAVVNPKNGSVEGIIDLWSQKINQYNSRRFLNGTLPTKPKLFL